VTDTPGEEQPTSPADRPTSARAWVLSAAIAAVVIVGFFLFIGRQQQNSSAPPVRTTPAAAPGDLSAGSAAPDFSATAFDGSTVKLSALKGKVVLVNFFASWCIECRAEMPAIESQYKAKHGSGFEVIGVDAWDSSDGKAFYQQVGATFPAVADPQQGNTPGPIAHAFGVDTPALPLSIFIDRDGKIHQVYPGAIDGPTITQQLKQMGIS
jgi:peroxiredoxin